MHRRTCLFHVSHRSGRPLALRRVVQTRFSSPQWIRLDWCHAEPSLTTRHIASCIFTYAVGSVVTSGFNRSVLTGLSVASYTLYEIMLRIYPAMGNIIFLSCPTSPRQCVIHVREGDEPHRQSHRAPSDRLK
jgi:hypothetical protein